MKKFAFLLLCLFTFYLAGMYLSLTLMVLACLELGFLPVLFFMSRYLKRHLTVDALQHGGAAVKGDSYGCAVRVKNTGRLPVSRFGIRLECGYGREERREVKHVYGGCERGETTMSFEVCGRHCGLLYLRMSRLLTYDYLSLFSASKRLEEEVSIAVFPRERELDVELPSLCDRESRLLQEQTVGQGQESRDEIRQLREYREEDSRRYIHWNQTAKTGQLWVKEYERETNGVVFLYLELEGFEEASAHRRDCFYELLSALILGLLKKIKAVRVSWYSGRRMCEEDVGNAAQCRDILLALYRAERVGSLSRESDLREGFVLDAKLGWYWRDSLVFQFSEEELERQMEGTSFVI